MSSFFSPLMHDQIHVLIYAVQNITLIRITNAPFLLAVCLYERQYLWKRSRILNPPKRQAWIAMWEQFGAHGDLHAVFDADPPQEIIDEMDDVDDVLTGDLWDGGDYVTALRRRRGSRGTSEIWSRSRSQHNMRTNGFMRRRSTRDEGVGTDMEGDVTPMLE
jgi:hypothetical protein